MNYLHFKNNKLGFVSLVVLATQLTSPSVRAMDIDTGESSSSSSSTSSSSDSSNSSQIASTSATPNALKRKHEGGQESSPDAKRPKTTDDSSSFVVNLEHKALTPDEKHSLLEKAKAGDRNAQDEVVDRGYCGLLVLPSNYKDEFYAWNNIEERCHQDDKYAYVALGLFTSQVSEKFPHLVNKIKERADQNIPAAQNNMGCMYYNGWGVAKNLESSFEWYMKAAQQGLAVAQYNIGNKYHKGEGTDKNPKFAFDWYMKAAQQGLAIAQNHVGNKYHKGEGTEKDLKLAFDWNMKAAQQGFASAQYEVGNMYSGGEGTEKDLKLAFDWYMKAAQQGFAWAQFNVANMYYRGEGTDKDQKLAFDWCMKAAQQGHAVSQNYVGNMYYRGEGTEKDLKLAFDWNMKAAQQGLAVAQNYVGNMYSRGKGVLKNEDRAFVWSMKAAQQGYALGQFNVGTLYLRGEGVLKNEDRAFVWYMKAAQQGYALGQETVGGMYYTGKGVPKNMDHSFVWAMKAAQQGQATAQKQVGSMYLKGEGVTAHLGNGIYWLTQSKKSNPFLKIYLKIPLIPGEMTEAQVEEKFTTLLTGKELNEGEEPKSGLHYLQNKYDLKAMPTLSENDPLSIPGLSATYEKIASRIGQFNVAVESFQTAECGLMLAPTTIAQDLKNCLVADKTNPLIGLHKFQDIDYLSFGQKNVALANQIVTCFEESIPEIKQRLAELASCYKTDLHNTEANLMRDQVVLQAMKDKAQYQEEFLKQSQKFAKKKERFQFRKTICDEKVTEIESDIKLLNESAEQFKTLIFATRGKRHADFLEEHPVYKD